MVETKTRSIDGLNFGVTQLPAMRGLRLFNRLGRVLAPAVARAAASQTDGEVQLEGLAGALDLLFAKLSDDELEGITRELLWNATVEGRPLLQELDATLGGKVGTLLKLVGFAVEVNYGGFFAVLRGLVPTLVPRPAASRSSSPPSASPSGQPSA